MPATAPAWQQPPAADALDHQQHDRGGRQALHETVSPRQAVMRCLYGRSALARASMPPPQTALSCRRAPFVRLRTQNQMRGAREEPPPPLSPPSAAAAATAAANGHLCHSRMRASKRNVFKIPVIAH